MADDPAPHDADATDKLAVVEERLAVGRTTEESGAVRVRIEVDRHDQTLDASRVEHRVEVERVGIGQAVEARREPWFDGDVLVVPVYAEEAVVVRRLMLVEELRLHRRSVSMPASQTVTLLRQRAVVERRMPDGRWVEAGAEESDR